MQRSIKHQSEPNLHSLFRKNEEKKNNIFVFICEALIEEMKQRDNNSLDNQMIIINRIWRIHSQRQRHTLKAFHRFAHQTKDENRKNMR